MDIINSHWIRVVRSHFVLCTFVGMVVVSFLRNPTADLRLLTEDMSVLDLLVASAFTGGLVAASTWLLHRLVLVPVLSRHIVEEDTRSWTREGTLTGFICGALGPVVALTPVLIHVLAGMYLVLIVSHVRIFLRRVAVVLRPGNFPRQTDVARLMFIYGSLAAGFTMLNYAIARLHPIDAPAYSGLGQQVPDILDLLYFSVVVMTTLGFGDIAPITTAAKLAVVLQVVTSYLLFALLIGTITRGILPNDESGTSKSDETC